MKREIREEKRIGGKEKRHTASKSKTEISTSSAMTGRETGICKFSLKVGLCCLSFVSVLITNPANLACTKGSHVPTT